MLGLLWLMTSTAADVINDPSVILADIQALLGRHGNGDGHVQALCTARDANTPRLFYVRYNRLYLYTYTIDLS